MVSLLRDTWKHAETADCLTECHQKTSTLEEAQALIETGFEYVTDMEIGKTTYKLFRKKKPWRPS